MKVVAVHFCWISLNEFHLIAIVLQHICFSFYTWLFILVLTTITGCVLHTGVMWWCQSKQQLKELLAVPDYQTRKPTLPSLTERGDTSSYI